MEQAAKLQRTSDMSIAEIAQAVGYDSQSKFTAVFKAFFHMIWSADPKEGHLTKQGIEKMRSAVTNEIFQDELLELYQAKDVSYKEVEEAQRSMCQLIREMGSTLTASPVIEEMISALAAELGGVKGKKRSTAISKSL